ncbi:MAG: nucleotidyltransferase domain-containing protein [Candidatus Pacearchaeota archaeon]
MRVDNILEEEKKKISLSSEEVKKLYETANNFIKLLKKGGLKAYIGGSLAKGTLIRKDEKQDIDIFVVFDYSEEMEKLEKFLNKSFYKNVKKIHGSRDYFQIEFPEAILEIIPVVKNVNPEIAENVTDVSLSHVVYVKNILEKKPLLADEIRLAKSFCKAQKCYGAESYIKGFSGYSLEVLVIYFGGFVEFLKGIKKKRVIDPVKSFKNENEILREINSSKLNSPIILVDPTYKYRNITAGLNQETFERFLKSSGGFLKNPSIEFFEEREILREDLLKMAVENKAKLFELEISTDRQEGDVAGSKMRKFFDFVVSNLEKKQQEILLKEFLYSGKGKKAKGFILVREKKEIEVRGPPIGLDEAVKKFKKAHKKVFLKKSYLWFKEKLDDREIILGLKKFEKEMGVKFKLK